MLRGLIKFFFFICVLVIAIFFAWKYVKPYINIERQTPQIEGNAPATPPKPLEALVIQQDEDQGKRFLRCTTSCQNEPIPHSLNSDALSDGQSWYYYTTSEKDEKTALVRFWPDKAETKVISQETDLIKPRDIYINPTGTKVAYFLDNVSQPKENLTEIWIYDTVSQSVSLAAENIYKPDLLTRLRWNAAGTALWFVADSGVGDESKIELIVIAAGNSQAKASFQNIQWQQLVDISDHGVMDISQAADGLAYVKRSLGVFDRLIVTRNGGQQYATSVTGSIPYLEWLPDNSLIYAVQDSLGFTFWKVQDEQASIIASQRGVLFSARADTLGESVAFAADTGQNSDHLFALNLSSRVIKEQAQIPEFGSKVFIVAVKENTVKPAASIMGAITQLADEQIAAFVDTNLNTIVQEKTAQKIRLIITDEPNTIFVDYQGKENEPKRILLTIKDAINSEWSIRARYEPKNGQWQKVEGGGLSDPKPVRLYEWEESLKKWVLKQSF